MPPLLSWGRYKRESLLIKELDLLHVIPLLFLMSVRTILPPLLLGATRILALERRRRGRDLFRVVLVSDLNENHIILFSVKGGKMMLIVTTR